MRNHFAAQLTFSSLEYDNLRLIEVEELQLKKSSHSLFRHSLLDTKKVFKKTKKVEHREEKLRISQHSRSFEASVEAEAAAHFEDI